jgi:hypothetical protein
MLGIVGMRVRMEMVRRPGVVGFGNVRVRRSVVMHMQPRRLRKSRQNGKAQYCSERRAHVPP